MVSGFVAFSSFYLSKVFTQFLLDCCVQFASRVLLIDLKSTILFHQVNRLVQWTLDLRKILTCKFTYIRQFSRFKKGKMGFLKSRVVCSGVNRIFLQKVWNYLQKRNLTCEIMFLLSLRKVYMNRSRYLSKIPIKLHY